MAIHFAIRGTWRRCHPAASSWRGWRSASSCRYHCGSASAAGTARLQQVSDFLHCSFFVFSFTPLYSTFARILLNQAPTTGVLLSFVICLVIGVTDIDMVIEATNFLYCIAALLEFAAFIKLRCDPPGFVSNPAHYEGESCIKNEETCITNEELCIENDEFCRSGGRSR